MTLENVTIRGAVMVSTRGFIGLHPDLQAIAMSVAIRRMNVITDFIVLDPEEMEGRYEDQRRTWHQSWKGGTKVYVKRDDHGTPEALSEWMGRPVKTQFLVTFMLAEEY